MAQNEIHKDDYGTLFIATIKDGSSTVDVSSATTKTLKFKKPSGPVLSKSGEFTTTGVDGKIQYLTVSGDLSEIGTWQVQGYVITPSGKWDTDINKFKVYNNLMAD